MTLIDWHNRLFVGLLLLSTMAMDSCKEDYFDEQAYTDLIHEAFPASVVAEDHLWSTVSTAKAVVSVAGAMTDTFEVRIFQESPVATHRGVLLWRDTITGAMIAARQFSYPSRLTEVCVAVTDAAGVTYTQMAPISDGVVSASFSGLNTASLRQDEYLLGTIRETPFSLRYCFEENFPEGDDYDFNDCVLSMQVQPLASGRVVRLSVTVDAVGSVGRMAAGLHIDGLKRSQVIDCWSDGFEAQHTYPWEASQIVKNGGQLLLNDAGLVDDDEVDGDVVVYLFNDAHYALNPDGYDAETYGSPTRQYYNTLVEYTNAYGRVIHPRTVDFYFRLRQTSDLALFTAQHLDPFVVVDYNGGYWEVHTMPFKTVQALSPYSGKDMRLYSDAYPWALLLPGHEFRYPVEASPIGYWKSGIVNGSYITPGHSFAEWAADPTQATDWYLYPNSEKVY